MSSPSTAPARSPARAWHGPMLSSSRTLVHSRNSRCSVVSRASASVARYSVTACLPATKSPVTSRVFAERARARPMMHSPAARPSVDSSTASERSAGATVPSRWVSTACASFGVQARSCWSSSAVSPRDRSVGRGLPGRYLVEITMRKSLREPRQEVLHAADRVDVRDGLRSVDDQRDRSLRAQSAQEAGQDLLRPGVEGPLIAVEAGRKFRSNAVQRMEDAFPEPAWGVLVRVQAEPGAFRVS